MIKVCLLSNSGGEYYQSLFSEGRKAGRKYMFDGGYWLWIQILDCELSSANVNGDVQKVVGKPIYILDSGMDSESCQYFYGNESHTSRWNHEAQLKNNSNNEERLRPRLDTENNTEGTEISLEMNLSKMRSRSDLDQLGNFMLTNSLRKYN